MPTVRFLPSQAAGTVSAGLTLLEAARHLGVEIPAACGGKGLCGKCRIRVLEGEVAPARGHECPLSPAELASGWRLACLARVHDDLVVEVPAAPARTVILTEFGRTEVPLETNLRAARVSMPAPSLDDQAADLERLGRALGLHAGPNAAVPVLRELPHVLRRHEWEVQAVLLGDELLHVEAPDGGPLLGLAVDLGTTTVAADLVNLGTGEDLATASCANPQAVHGDDVISRIEHAAQSPEALAELQGLAAEAVNDVAARAAEAAGAAPERIFKVVVAGNTTMQHLFLGLSPQGIGRTPFVAVQRRGASLPAYALGLRTAPHARLYVMPSISGYVGGDVVAGLLAHEVHRSAHTILYIDIGTNGEIALRANGQTYACSTAAGPAFEGARISCGMRAASGAILHVASDTDDLRIETVDREPARGMCGTGLLDAAATFLDLGLLDDTGRLLADSELPAAMPVAVRARMDTGDSGPGVVLAAAPGGPRVVLTQADLRELQLAKGAVAAGVGVLLEHAGCTEADIDTVLLAGAFGSYLRPQSAQRVGLIPPEARLDRVAFVGNAALAGARAALLNVSRRAAAEALAQEVRYVELSGRADFQARFMETMHFPA